MPSETGGALLASGHYEIRSLAAVWFSEPDLHARLLSRTVLGSLVIDHEEVTRKFPEGLGTVELVCIDAMEQGSIQSATFSFGPPF